MNLTDPIIPAVSAAGIALGERIDAIVRRVEPISIDRFHGVEKYLYDGVTIWVRDGKVQQISVRKPYTGQLNGGVTIGTTISEIERLMGRVAEDHEDNLVVEGSPGWCFDTEQWTKGSARNNRNARVAEIFVFRPPATTT